MKISLHYDEINRLIKKHTGHEIELEHVNTDIIHVAYNLTLPFIGKKKIGFDVKIVGFDDTTLKMKVTSDVFSKLLSLVPTLNFSQYAIIDNDNISIPLNNIEELKKPLTIMHPTTLYSYEDCLLLEGELL